MRVVLSEFDLPAELARYLGRHPDAAALTALFQELHDGRSDPDPYGRRGDHGHFTASALVLSGDRRRVALMHHRKLGLWLQPGGHADGDRDLRRVAIKEVEEETGLTDLRVEPDIFDLDRHRIPARPGEPAHWHYDVRFVVHAGSDETLRGNGESRALAWCDAAEIASGGAYDDSLARMARRWLQRCGVVGSTE